MKNSVLIILILFSLSFNWIQSQDSIWYTYEIDSLVDIDLPGEAYEMDTVIKDIQMYQLFSKRGNSSFILQKALLEANDIDENLSKLPHDSASLERTYENIIKGIANSMPSKLSTKLPIYYKDFKGYELEFSDSSRKRSSRVRLFILNRHYYAAMYFNLTEIQYAESELFLDSFNIKNISKISQYCGVSQAQRIGYLIGYYSIFILIIVAVIVFVIRKIIN